MKIVVKEHATEIPNVFDVELTAEINKKKVPGLSVFVIPSREEYDSPISEYVIDIPSETCLSVKRATILAELMTEAALIAEKLNETLSKKTKKY